MKKVLLLTLALCMLVSSFAIAAPSVDHIFSVTENGKVYYYMFGTTDKTATDVGLTINGKDYNLDANALLKAQSSGKYGIGIADPNDILGDDFTATPYEVVNGERQTAANGTTVTKNEVDNIDVIALDSLTINGKAVAGFYTGTTETDFYYGLDEITSEADIPAVSYSLSTGNATTSLAEEKGGYVYTISATDGTKNTDFKVHFREFAEVTASVKPTIAYRQHYSYMNTTGDLAGLSTVTSLNIATKTEADETSVNNTYLYFAYDVSPVSGYAPVSFDLVGLKARYNPLNLYVYDGDLSDVTLPKTVAETEANSTMFAGNKGLNETDAFHLLRCDTEADTVWKTTGIAASSTVVSDGNNILIVKSELPQIGSYPAYILYEANYYMTMNVKYVEKNPKDETDVDTSLSSLTINGEEPAAIKDDVYYVAVEDIDNIGEMTIEATPTYADGGAKAEVSAITDNQATVTVTAKDGETTGTYTVKFKEIISKDLTAESSYPYIRWNSGSSKYGYSSRTYWKSSDLSDGMESASSNIDVTYAQFPTEFDSDADILLVSDAILKGTTTRYQIYEFYNTTYDVIASGLGLTFSEFTENKATYLGKYDCTTSHDLNLSVTFDSALLDIKTDGKIKIALIDGYKDGNIVEFASEKTVTLTINYITLD